MYLLISASPQEIVNFYEYLEEIMKYNLNVS